MLAQRKNGFAQGGRNGRLFTSHSGSPGSACVGASTIMFFTMFFSREIFLKIYMFCSSTIMYFTCFAHGSVTELLKGDKVGANQRRTVGK